VARLTDHASAHRSLGLDVARVLAAGAVLVTHAGAIFLPQFGLTAPITLLMAAYFGVELFFVLSGFLIGRLLLQIADTDATARGWLVFMVRRWMRTLPLYYLCLLALPLLLPAPPHLGARLLSYATMTQNLLWPMPADQWFNQSWSLTIEEWFYLLFSAALVSSVALARSRRAIWPVILAFIVAPAVARVLRPEPVDFQNDMYHLALLRLDAIAYGVALAKLYQEGSRLFRHPRVALGLGVALIAVFWEQDVQGVWLPVGRMAFLNLQLFCTSVGLCLFLVGLLPLRVRWRPLAWAIGAGSRLSYGIYLLHLPIIDVVLVFAVEHGYGRLFVVIVSSVLILLVPTLAYRLVEAPLMARRPRQGRLANKAAAGQMLTAR
jgi:peptidoglycan/LPS O-acetylase OafA/YrhL